MYVSDPMFDPQHLDQPIHRTMDEALPERDESGDALLQRARQLSASMAGCRDAMRNNGRGSITTATLRGH